MLVDVPVATSVLRRPGPTDRFETEGEAFLERVADAFRALAAAATDPWLVVDGTAPVEAVAEAVADGVRAIFETVLP